MNAIMFLPSLLLLLNPAGATHEEDAIMAADSHCSAESLAKGLEGFLSCFAEDAVTLPKDGAPVRGKAAIRESTRPTFATPGSTLTWQPIHAEAAQSADLGYSFGTYEFKGKGKNGEPVSSTGKYTSVWRKQKDGQWKIILDVGN